MIEVEQRQKERHKKRNKRKTLFLLLTCACVIIGIISFDLLLSVPLTKQDKQQVKLQNSEISNNDSILDIDNNLSSNGEEIIEDTTWCLILVNKWNLIPEKYEVTLTELTNGQLIDERIYPALQEMFDTARKNNVYPIVASGYRTADRQQELLDEKIADYKSEGYELEEAIKKAEAWVALPGTSEHQLGIGVDINADGIHSTGEEVYDWLNKNSYKFGFICRYPSDKTDITGIINEPWHYRYVGINVATEMHNQNICLEEYLNKTD